MQSRSLDADAYRVDIHQMAHLQGKSLVIIMVPLFTLLVWALDRRARPSCSKHLVFSFYAFAFWLIWVGLCNVLSDPADRRVNPSGLQARFQRRLNLDLGAAVVLPFRDLPVIWLCSLQNGGRPAVTMLKTAILSGWLFGVLTTYRFILFFTTFYAT